MSYMSRCYTPVLNKHSDINRLNISCARKHIEEENLQYKIVGRLLSVK